MITIKVKRGDTWIFTAKWRDLDGEPIDLASCTARQNVIQVGHVAPVLELTSVAGDITFVDDPDEIADLLCNTVVRVEAADMAALDVDDYEFDQEITFINDSDRVLSTDTMRLRIVEDKTV